MQQLVNDYQMQTFHLAPCSNLKKKDHGKGFQIEHLFTTSQFLLIFLLPEANEEEQQSTHRHTEMSYPMV
jgi:hypothetical protein